MLTNKSVVLLKLNSGAYGTDSAPVATDAMLVGPVKVEPQIKKIERKVVLPHAGNLADIQVGESVKVSFPIEVFGSGSPVTAPKHSPILKAAGFIETLTAEEVSDSGAKLSGWQNITGVNSTNCEASTGRLYVSVTGASPYTLDIYKDAAKTQLVAHCADYTTTGAKAIVADSGSGLGGTITVDTTGTTNAVCGWDYRYDESMLTDEDDFTLYYYEDGILYKILGCVTDSLKMDLKPNDIGIMECSFIGLWGGNAAFASDVAMAATDFGTLQIPPRFNSASFTVHTYAGLISKFGISVANKTIPRPDANAASGINRFSFDPKERKITGGLDPEMVSLATFNPWNLMETSALGVITASLGSTAGNRMVISSPNTQLTTKIGDRDGIRTYEIDWEAKVTLLAGTNRIQFKFN